jgi:hypothetical protein
MDGLGIGMPTAGMDMDKLQLLLLRGAEGLIN